MKHNFKNLEIWKDGVDLAVEVYQLTNSFPEREKFGLTAQVRKCAVSIPSNIAEGAGRTTNKDFSNFLNIANGSSNEMETQLIIAERLGLISTRESEPVIEKLTSIRKRVCSLQSKLGIE